MSEIISRKDSDMNLIIWMVVVPVAVDLFTTGGITWSRWAIFGFLIIYFMRMTKEHKVDDQALTILKERYAKGELSEEEFIKIKTELEAERTGGSQVSGNRFLGYALIFVGAVFILRNLFFSFRMPFYLHDLPVLPIILIGIGVYWVYRNLR
ncbi:MAG: SHOCT domain-containing protein [bacterium]|nr:SHOCT domain-containing protein [bacterium]